MSPFEAPSLLTCVARRYRAVAFQVLFLRHHSSLRGALEIFLTIQSYPRCESKPHIVKLCHTLVHAPAIMEVVGTDSNTFPLDVVHCQRQTRRSPTSVDVEAIYYVMEGVIYQAPTVKKLMRSRLDKFTYHLNNAFGEYLV